MQLEGSRYTGVSAGLTSTVKAPLLAVRFRISLPAQINQEKKYRLLLPAGQKGIVNSGQVSQMVQFRRFLPAGS